MTYHTAMGDESAEVEPTISILSGLHHLLDDWVLAKLALLDRLVDADDVLPHDSAGANVQVADLGIAHEPLGQADSKRRGLQLGVSGLALRELVHDGSLGRGNSVTVLGRLLRRDPPTIDPDCTSVKP